jgi:hypothetical protein
VDEAVWVELGQVHSYVERVNPGAPLAEIQAETLDLVRADSLKRIRHEYVQRYDDKDRWPWYSWLDLTPEGKPVAHAIEAKLNQATDTSTG